MKYAVDTTKTSSNDSSAFNLDVSTGRITLAAQVLDFESGKTNYEVYFNSMNADNTALVSKTQFHLTVTVTDVNDNSPVFSQTLYSFNVTEGVPQGTLVGTVSASDADVTSSFKNFAYYIMNKQNQDAFYVEKQSGKVFASGLSLNRAVKESHLLTVCVSDGGKEPAGKDGRSSCTEVSIKVLPQYDGAYPLVMKNFAFAVNEHAAVGKVVGKVRVEDVQKDVEYHFVGDMTGKPFALDKSSGNVSLTGKSITAM